MRKRPKKPEEPKTVDQELGYSLTFEEFKEQIDKFAEDHDVKSLNKIEIFSGGTYYDESTIVIQAPAGSLVDYNKDMVKYKKELKEYKKWQLVNKVRIERHTAENKKAINIRVLERRLFRAQKDTEDITIKLNKILCNK